jgi:hypothetical protein
MKFAPILDLWDNGVQDALYSGALRLQRGQWIKCGKDSRPSRFVRANKNQIWLVHYSPCQTARFAEVCAIFKRKGLK